MFNKLIAGEWRIFTSMNIAVISSNKGFRLFGARPLSGPGSLWIEPIEHINITQKMNLKIWSAMIDNYFFSASKG